MHEGSSYILPALLAVLVHALAFASVTLGWKDDAVEAVHADEKLYVEAMLVKENPIRARERKQQEVRRSGAAAEEERKRLDRQVLEKKAAEDAARKREAKQKKLVSQTQKAIEEEAVKELDANRQVELAEEERRRNEWGLSLSIVEEQEYRRAVTDDEKAQAYVAQIRRDIVANWSRPPSARNGMEAVLKVFLAPTGEVVNVAVVESSGNDAFDRSAVLAVRKAERFLVPTDPRQFARNFREFSVLFRPEDLRQ
jgi:colicin import membrane protein